MASTTVVSDDSATAVISDERSSGIGGHRFSWSAIFSGALVATAVTFFLLALGTGFGLSLISVRHAADDAATFLTLGAIYFFAAQAFGFAAGGHVTGRLIGPAPETRAEEEFLAGAHGLVTWALTVVATAALIYLGAIATGTVAGGSLLGTTNATAITPEETNYWVDRLFRPAPIAAHASLDGRKFAQLDSDTESDATPSDQNTAPTVDNNTNSSTTTPPGQHEGVEHVSPTPSAPAINLPTATVPPGQPMNSAPPVSGEVHGNIASDKAEAARILSVGTANGAVLSEVDRVQLAQLVAQDTGQSQDAAEHRVDNVVQQMHDAQTQHAETARRIAAYASLWTALALLFGSVVAVMATVSARWEDDKVTFGFPVRRAS